MIPKPKPPAGWPTDGKHLDEHPEVWDDSPLNPENWPPRMKRKIPVDSHFVEDKDKNDGPEKTTGS